MVGDPAVGKTSLIRKFVYDMFDDKYLVTLGAKVTKKVIKIPIKSKNFEVKLMIWDIAGQKTFGEIRSAYYRGSEGAILICDVTDKDTLNNLNSGVTSIFKITKKIPIIFLANKIDLKDKIQFGRKELEKNASYYKSPFLFTSAKTGENVEKAFQTIGKVLLDDF